MAKLLEIKDLVVNYHTDDGIVHAVNGVNLSVEKGKTVGLVGETGAGKSTTVLSILNLIDSPPGKVEQGSILFEGNELVNLDKAGLKKLRGKDISMIFQDPMTALNPVLTVVDQIAEVIENHQNISGKEAEKRAIEMLELVNIPAERAFEYPHQFSGGMKQRVVIAIALACNPKLLIADEPTTALDVTIQAQVLELMRSLRKKLNTSMILITHDLGVVAEICDEVAIMYAGEIIEKGNLEQIFDNPQHPYTNGLFGSIPDIDKEVEYLSPIEGLMPDPGNLPTGCKFHPRCKYAEPICAEVDPEVVETEPGHCTKCLIYGTQLKTKEVVKYE
ncbi:MAG: ABC transporter ATP-binding protein [Lachnospiraceae bacterium]